LPLVSETAGEVDHFGKRLRNMGTSEAIREISI
jgi:hypothetical protein